MSAIAFNALFIGYPENEVIQRCRDQLRTVLENAPSLLRRMQSELETATLKERESLYDAITSIDNITLNLAPWMPEALTQVMAEHRVPFLQATRAYSDAAARRRGLLRQAGMPTEEEFDSCKRALRKVLDDLITWVESVTPEK